MNTAKEMMDKQAIDSLKNNLQYHKGYKDCIEELDRQFKTCNSLKDVYEYFELMKKDILIDYPETKQKLNNLRENVGPAYGKPKLGYTGDRVVKGKKGYDEYMAQAKKAKGEK